MLNPISFTWTVKLRNSRRWSNQFLNIVWNFYNNNSSSKINNSKWNNKIIIITVILMLCKFLVKTSLPNPGLREKINLSFYFHTSLWCRKRSYVVVIARCRVQYGKYFPRFWICNVFCEPVGGWNNNKLWETRKIFSNIARGKVAWLLIVKCLLKSNVARVILLINCSGLACKLKL